jgi:hypothetical protein
MNRAPVAPQIPWPTPEQLQKMGLVRCEQAGCSVYVDPANLPARRCLKHGRPTRQTTERPLAELRFAPLPEFDDRPRRRRDNNRDRRKAAA